MKSKQKTMVRTVVCDVARGLCLCFDSSECDFQVIVDLLTIVGNRYVLFRIVLGEIDRRGEGAACWPG
jgi:hypothetical protein